MTARAVTIYGLSILAHPDRDQVTLRVDCGKGTYVRSLARDLARAVGSAGHVVMLRRTVCAGFHEGNAISLDKLREIGHTRPLLDFLLPLATALDDIPALAASAEEARHLAQGRPFPLSLDRGAADLEGVTVTVMADQRLVALARVENGFVRSIRVMNMLS